MVQTSINNRKRINTIKSLKILLRSSAPAFIIYEGDDPEHELISPILRLLDDAEDIDGEFMRSVSYNLQPRRVGIGSAIIHLEGNGENEDYGTYSLNLEHKILNGCSRYFAGAYGGISVELIPHHESEYLAIVYRRIKFRNRN